MEKDGCQLPFIRQREKSLQEEMNIVVPKQRGPYAHRRNSRYLQYHRDCLKSVFRDLEAAEKIFRQLPSLRQVEYARPCTISFQTDMIIETCPQKPIKPPPTVTSPSCSGTKEPWLERVTALAAPRKNWKEMRKKELERCRDIYKVPRSALRAIPTPRIIELAKPKRINIPRYKHRLTRKLKVTKLKKPKQPPVPQAIDAPYLRRVSYVVLPDIPCEGMKVEEEKEHKRRPSLADIIIDIEEYAPPPAIDVDYTRRRSYVLLPDFPYEGFGEKREDSKEKGEIDGVDKEKMVGLETETMDAGKAEHAESEEGEKKCQDKSESSIDTEEFEENISSDSSEDNNRHSANDKEHITQSSNISKEHSDDMSELESGNVGIGSKGGSMINSYQGGSQSMSDKEDHKQGWPPRIEEHKSSQHETDEDSTYTKPVKFVDGTKENAVMADESDHNGFIGNEREDEPIFREFNEDEVEYGLESRERDSRKSNDMKQMSEIVHSAGTLAESNTSVSEEFIEPNPRTSVHTKQSSEPSETEQYCKDKKEVAPSDLVDINKEYKDSNQSDKETGVGYTMMEGNFQRNSTDMKEQLQDSHNIEKGTEHEGISDDEKDNRIGECIDTKDFQHSGSTYVDEAYEDEEKSLDITQYEDSETSDEEEINSVESENNSDKAKKQHEEY